MSGIDNSVANSFVPLVKYEMNEIKVNRNEMRMNKSLKLFRKINFLIIISAVIPTPRHFQCMDPKSIQIFHLRCTSNRRLGLQNIKFHHVLLNY